MRITNRTLRLTIFRQLSVNWPIMVWFLPGLGFYLVHMSVSVITVKAAPWGDYQTMLQQWTLSLKHMHHFFSARFSEWLLGSSPTELLCELRSCVRRCVFFQTCVCWCMWSNHICFCVSLSVCIVRVNPQVCACGCMLRVLVCGVAGCVCMHVEWHLAECGRGRGNIWVIIEVP